VPVGADLRSQAVSVVIPTRNRSALLARALTSALNQQGLEVEIIVVDDASTDPTRNELAARDYPNIRWIHHEKQRGVSAARNSGVGAASCRWIAFLDDDDLWSPTKLQMQLERAAIERASFVCCGAVTVDPRLMPLETQVPPRPDRLLRELLSVNAVPGGGSGVLASIEAVREVGGFDQELSILADWDMWIRLAEHHSASSVDDILVANLVHPGNMIVSDFVGQLQGELDYLAAKHARLLAGGRFGFDRKRMIHWSRVQRRRATRLRAEEQQAHGMRLASAATYFASALPARHPGAVLWGLLSLLGDPGVATARRLQSRLRPPSHLRPMRPSWLESYVL
jgi:glycosyltransferase involved in cell wall biosynthesis